MKRKLVGKTLVSFMLALSLLLSLCGTAAAEDSVLVPVIDAAEKLLFHTHNVTMKGTAVFSLDGETFKTADCTYVQADADSFWDVALTTPRKNGLQHTGYTVIANDRMIYVMEPYNPGVYRAGNDDTQDTPMRRSVHVDQLVAMTRNLVTLVEPGFKNCLSSAEKDGVTVTSFSMNESDFPAVLNTLLNLGAQTVVSRLLPINYDQTVYGVDTEVPMANYISPTTAIIDSTLSFRVTKAEGSVSVDSEGRIVAADADIQVRLTTKLDGEHDLAVRFSGTVSDYGSSVVKEFNPADYNVRPQEEVYPESGVEFTDMEGWFISRARFVLLEAGFSEEELAAGTVELHNEEPAAVTFSNEDGEASAACVLDNAGGILEFRKLSPRWLSEGVEIREKTVPEDKPESWAKVLKLYMEDVDPGLSEAVAELKDGQVFTVGEETYMELKDMENGAFFVVRTAPSWRVDYLSLLNDWV